MLQTLISINRSGQHDNGNHRFSDKFLPNALTCLPLSEDIVKVRTSTMIMPTLKLFNAD